MIVLWHMKRLCNWACHRNKVPINPKTGAFAKSNDPNTWGTYEQAKEWMERDKSISGLGFMFENSPYVGIDIDHCIQDDKISEFAREIINTFQSYTEISPSGTGVHIICKGKLRGTGRKNIQLGLEIYDSGRFFTVTENAFKLYPNIIDCQNEIDELCKKYFSKKENSSTPKNPPKQQQLNYLDDEKLIEIAKKSKNGAKFADLYTGNWQTYYKSQSEADMAFCNMLAFWTCGDCDQMDRIFRSSGLMRDKWNQRHGINTYGDMTITKAVDCCEEWFQPSQIRDFNDIKRVETRTETVQNSTEISQSSTETVQNGTKSSENSTEVTQNDTKTNENSTEMTKNDTKNNENSSKTSENNTKTAQNDTETGLNLEQFHRFNAKNQVIGVFDAMIRDYIIETEHIVVIGGMAYVYRDGVYQMDAQGVYIKNKIRHLIYKEFQKAYTINSIYQLLLMEPCLHKTYSEVNLYPKHWINFKNGMFDVKTFELLPHDPKYYAMNQIPHEWKWKGEKIDFKGDYTDYFFKTSFHDEDKQTLFEYLGYCMTRSTKFQIFLLIKGEGDNGKSIIIDMFNAVIGEQNISSIGMDKLTERFYPAQLLFKLCNTCADISKVSIEDDAELKKIIAGDKIQAEFKGQNSFDFRPYAKLLFSANRFPHVDDRSEGFKRRLRVINMNKKPPKKDRELTEKLMKEIDYWIFCAILYLANALEQDEIKESETAREAKEELHKDSDSVYAFVNDCLERVEGRNVFRARMFEEYDRYCIENERMRVKKKTFFDEMKAKGFSTKIDNKGYVVYVNVHIKAWNDDFNNVFYNMKSS